MIAALFLNPGFLFVAAALISVPIIIHLINRMRYKRVRWGAMEFLLKAMKRTRRRLIIEQLLLLALRCLLIGLVGLLVSRFIGCSNANLNGKPNLHLVLLDDTLSMQDQWAQGTEFKSAFDVAKNDILIKKISKGLSLSKTNDKLIILPLSKIDDLDAPKVYEGLNNIQRRDEFDKDVTDMQPSMLHVKILDAVKAAEKIIANNPESTTTLHLVGDFRQKDWSRPAGKGLQEELLELVKKNRDVKVRLIDTVFPVRSATQGAFPTSRDNVGILDIRPSTRVAGRNMPVQFIVSIINFGGKPVEAHLEARDEVAGKDMLDVNFTTLTSNPSGKKNEIILQPDAVTNVSFDYRFNPEIKPNASYFAHLTVRLTNAQKQPLDNDGLLADNLRHVSVEVRDKVPVLVVDGEGPEGRKEGKDSFFLSRGLTSVPGESYKVVYADEIAGGNPTKALERADLNQYPTIFLLNVHKLDAKQAANLENYVKEGGGVAFYLGPNVIASEYNKYLYKDGKGIFPAPLKEIFFPGPNDAPLEPKSSDTFQILIREEKFSDPTSVPIFGAMFEDPKHKEPLRDLPIRRYFQVNRSAWKQEPGRVFELATLPNDASILSYQPAVLEITQGGIKQAIFAKGFANGDVDKYLSRLQQLLTEIENLVAPGSEAKAYHLAGKIESMFNEKGNKAGAPDMTEFWANGNDKIQSLRHELASLREQVGYGDPFVIASSFGKGKVVAIMSTAGKDWNDWGGGPASAVLYAPFIWETQNFLSSQGSESNLTVGTNLELPLLASQFNGAQLKMVRYFMKTDKENAAQKVVLGEPQFGKEDGGRILFSLTKNNEPGLYVSEVYNESSPNKAPIAVYAHTFNVDTKNEGNLQRVGSEELDRDLLSKSDGAIKMVSSGSPDDQLIGKINDFSESPWLFLLLLLVLVAEQALAVHLSFHMRSGENVLPASGRSA